MSEQKWICEKHPTQPMGHNGCDETGMLDLRAEGCMGGTCKHDSDCAIHNAPALPVGPCDCSLSEASYSMDEIIHAWEQAGIDGDFSEFVTHLGTRESKTAEKHAFPFELPTFPSIRK